MCADQWDRRDVDVACQMMNFNGSLSADFEYEENKENEGQVWLNNMNCTGNETSLLSCIHGGLGSHDCKGKRKAGVKCRPEGENVY